MAPVSRIGFVLLSAVLFAFILPDASRAQMGCHANSLEWLVAESTLVVRARVADFACSEPEAPPLARAVWMTVTLDVAEVVKGEPVEQVTFAVRHLSCEVYGAWRDQRREHLWFLRPNDRYQSAPGPDSLEYDVRYPLRLVDPGWGIIRLGAPVEAERYFAWRTPPIFMMSLEVLEDPQEILAAARAAAAYGRDADQTPREYIIEMPHEIMRGGGRVGDFNTLSVPADERLRVLARRLIETPESFLPAQIHIPAERAGDAELEAHMRRFIVDHLRAEGVKALSWGPLSERDTELLVSVLEDPAGVAASDPRDAAFLHQARTRLGDEAPPPPTAVARIEPGQALSTAALAAVHGPQGLTFEERELQVDLDGDGNAELLRLLFDTRRGLDSAVELRDLRSVVHCDGFALFTWVDGEVVPVFYAYECFDGWGLRLGDVEGRLLLSAQGGRDGVQRAWGWWRDAKWENSFGDAWMARSRVWDDAEKRYGHWRDGPLIDVRESK